MSVKGLYVLRVRELEAVVALALVVSVAFILITPDSSDDVDAVLHLVKAGHSHTLGHVFVLNIVPLVRVSGLMYAAAAPTMTLPFPELLCTYRC